MDAGFRIRKNPMTISLRSFIFSCIFAIFTCISASGAEYSNPVVVVDGNGGAYWGSAADPCVVRAEDGSLYCFVTGRKVFRSEDGCRWNVVTEQLFPKPTWGNAYYGKPIKAEVWAPDVCKVNEKWIYYYSLSGWGMPCGIGYAVADEISGPYRDMGPMFTCREIGIENCIDPQVIVEDDGSVFMVMGSFRGLYLIELTSDGLACRNGTAYQKEHKTLIAGYPGPWDGATYEGSWILKKDGFYYYFGSVGTCCERRRSTYHVRVARSKDIRGPYCGKDGVPLTEAGNGKTYGELVVHAGDSPAKQVFGPGHNSVLQDDAGEYWLCYHAYTDLDACRTRHFFLDRLLWDADGFPYVKDRHPSFQETLPGPQIRSFTE